jgi:hypothetical protein
MSTPLTGTFLVTRVMSGCISKANGISEINLWDKLIGDWCPEDWHHLSFIPFKLPSSKFISHEVLERFASQRWADWRSALQKLESIKQALFGFALAKTAPFIPAPVTEQDKRFALQIFVPSSSAPVKSACWSLALEKKGLMRQELTVLNPDLPGFGHRGEATLFQILDTW